MNIIPNSHKYEHEVGKNNELGLWQIQIKIGINSHKEYDKPSYWQVCMNMMTNYISANVCEDCDGQMKKV